jgi:hypothetical protein
MKQNFELRQKVQIASTGFGDFAKGSRYPVNIDPSGSNHIRSLWSEMAKLFRINNVPPIAGCQDEITPNS